MSPVIRSVHSTLALEARAQRARIYRDPRWRGHNGTRSQVLHRAYHQCEWFGCAAEATIADHYPHTLQQILDTGGDPYDPHACRALCAHHSGKADGGHS